MDTGMAAESILPRFEPHQESRIGDILFIEDNRYQLDDSCIETVYTLTRGSETLTRTGLQWVFTLREIRSMMERAGLAVERCYGSVGREPSALRSPLTVLVARKR
jgi:hypothetical protein